MKMKQLQKKFSKLTILIPSMVLLATLLLTFVYAVPAMAATCGTQRESLGKEVPLQTTIDLGCKGNANPIILLFLAFTRFLIAGVGVVIIGSVIVGGIQYTSASGDPQATAKAKSRIANALLALLFYLGTFALLNWLIPGGLL